MLDYLKLALGALSAFFGWRQSVSEETHDTAERQGGADAQKASTDEAALKEVKDAKAAANAGDAMSDDDVRRVSDKWTRPPSAGGA